jgi:uncharacterized protein YhbP (UPF0306 family)
MTAALENIRIVFADGTLVPSEPPSQDRVQRSVKRVLDDTALCAWATVTPDGHAHINTGYFGHSEALELYLLSHPGSGHSQNLATNSSMAVAVFASAQNWSEPGRGIQLFGKCEQITGSDAVDAEHIYVQRFPAYAIWKATLRTGDPALDYRFYRFIANRVKILDEAEFGDAVWVQAEVVRD